MLFAFAACLTWAPALWGFGALLAPRALDELRPVAAGFLGFAALALGGIAVNFIAPVSPEVAAVVWALGTALFAWRGREVLVGIGPTTLVAMALLLLGLCALVQLPGRHYDMGLYYLQAVRWTQEQRAPLGLATLHSRFGFNASWFVVAAMLEHPLAVGRSAFVANTLAVWFGVWAVWAGLRRVRAGDTSPPALLLVATVLPISACLEGIGAQGPDYPAALLVYLSIALGVAALEQPERFELHASVGSLLTAFAFTVKVSTAPLLAAWAILLVVRRRSISRVALAATGATGALLALWVARGLVLSGCPLFPSTIGCMPLAWATPPSVGENVSAWIRSWARLPGASPEVVLASWDWLGPWARAASDNLILRIVAGLLAVGVATHAVRPRATRPEVIAGWAAAVAGVLGWLLTAPTVRFGLGFLFAAGLVPVAGSALIRATADARAGKVALLVALGALTFVVARSSLRWTRHLTAANASWVGWPELPAGAVQPRRTASGLVVYVPRRGDKCWSAPLPCTPYFDPGLAYDGMFRTSTPEPKN